MQNPQFEGQTKTKLGNEIKGRGQTVVGEGLREHFEENPSVARKIVEKMIAAARAREAARKARPARRKTILDGGSLPGSSPTARGTTRRSASSTSSRATRPRLGEAGPRLPPAAILPIRGKILNVEKARIDKILANEEIRSIGHGAGRG